MDFTLSRRLTAEFLGSLILTMTAISPTILGYNVLGAGIPLTVLMDAIAVGFVLFMLIEALGPISGAHFNPAVTLSFMAAKSIKVNEGILYISIQFLGGFVGMLCSSLMFYQDVPKLIQISTISRSGGAYFSEFICTFTLVLAIWCLSKSRSRLISLAIGTLVGGFIIGTSSTMFANPQVTFARMFTYAIAGIRPEDGIIFIFVELLAALVATGVATFLFKENQTTIKE
jgi:glycerol uptake facilitator-like aquaporin